MRIPGRMMPHGGLVTYRAKLGTTGAGKAAYGPLVTPARASIQDVRRLVRGSASERLSNATVWLDPEHWVEVGSEMTIWIGRPQQRVAEVLQVLTHEAGRGLPEHFEYLLT